MLDFLNRIPVIILGLPAVLLSLSIHEASHAYAAYKLGDPTAKNLGRLTINPLKHINLFGFICMILFHIGWANPVPINPRNFKDSKKGMAISAAAGPLSNLCLAIISVILLRLVLIPIESIADTYSTDLYYFWGSYGLSSDNTYWIHPELRENATFVILSIIATMLTISVALNLNLMFFNLIPLPPLDGSRLALMFLDTNTYFNIMKYELYIQIAFIFLLGMGMITLPLNFLTGGVTDFFYNILGIKEDLITVVNSEIYNRLPTFTF